MKTEEEPCFKGIFPQQGRGVGMELPMWSRKRPLFNGNENEPPFDVKRCSMSLETGLDRSDRGRLDQTPEASMNGGTKHTGTKCFLHQMSSWAHTQYSANKVMVHLQSRRADDDILLDDLVTKKFLEFHRDMTEECGAEDKQHSWAVIEKQEEIIMYGPYYPNYNSGAHSEDIIIEQTQELLQSDSVSAGRKVYVFTMNSPCLARYTYPCMLKLVHKAQEWWSVYGVKTHIGYVKCWGFKGPKETLFREMNYSQVECIDQTEDYESFVKAAEKSADLTPLCENTFSAVKSLLRSLSFPPLRTVQGHDWRNYFKNMHSILPEDRENFTQEVNSMIEAAQSPLSQRSASLEECLEKGRVFAQDYAFSSQVSDAIQDQMRLSFQQCWRETVLIKYTEFIREQLTEGFNQSTVQLFIKDVVKFTQRYLQIGRIQFPEEESNPSVVSQD